MSAVVPSSVAEWAGRAPGSVAVWGPGGPLSYGELVARADRLARVLVARGVRPGDVVGVCLGRDESLVVALLAVMRAGAAYLPLDPGHPPARLEFMVRDAGARLVVGAGVPADVAETVDVSTADAADEAVLPEVGPGDLAYVIYTSGSTGTPKGVAVEHGSVARLFDRVGEFFDWSPSDVWSCYHSAAFDFSVWEIWGALSSGGQVVLVSYEDSRDPVAFRELLDARGITMVSLTPSALLRLMPHGLPSGVRHVVLGGEAVRPRQIAPLLGLPQRIWNLYGITETTVHATVRELTAQDADDDTSPIGAPLGDLTFAIVDDNGEQLPAGRPGELWIAGAGLARGYVDRPELTAERFVDAAVGGVRDRWYRTGDAVREIAPGEYDYIGRLDRQVQLRGFRIELGEVEAALEAHDGIAVAVVELVDEKLVAFLTLGAAATAEDLREWLSDRLPDHMLPSSFSVVPAMPLTGNGKLDRAALRTMDARPLPERGGTADLASPAERLLAGIWAEVLGRTAVSGDDHFFTIGGDSMSALRVAMAAEEEGLELGVRDLFLHPVLADLAAAAAPATGAPPAEVAAAQSAAGTDGVEQSYPALRIQAGMLFESERDPDRPTYHVVSENVLESPAPDRDGLASALSAVTKAQPGLRTGFDLLHEDGPLQLVRELPDPPLRFEDLTALAPAEADERLAEIRRAERASAFTWDDFPLWRLTCAVLPGGRARLFLTHHHAVLDGWSVAVFFDQLRAALSGEAVTSPADACLLAAEAEAEALGSAESASHWSAIAREWQALEVPSRRRADGEPPVWSVTRPVEKQVRDDVDRVCAAWRCSPKQLFVATHLRALEVAAGPGRRPGAVVVVNARPEASDVHLAVGVFLNAMPVLPAPPGATWRDRVGHVAAAELEMLEHRHYPFADMRGRLGLPSPTTWFTYTDFGGTSMGDFLASVTDHNVTELPLTVSVVDDGLLVDGSSDHFTRAEVEELARVHLECLHGAIQAALQRPV